MTFGGSTQCPIDGTLTLQDKDRVIKTIKTHVRRFGTVPETTTDYYKLVKEIGKGAFGKVSLAIHKLTGKYVAIKSFDKEYMKDSFSRKKVF